MKDLCKHIIAKAIPMTKEYIYDAGSWQSANKTEDIRTAAIFPVGSRLKRITFLNANSSAIGTKTTEDSTKPMISTIPKQAISSDGKAYPSFARITLYAIVIIPATKYAPKNIIHGSNLYLQVARSLSFLVKKAAKRPKGKIHAKAERAKDKRYETVKFCTHKHTRANKCDKTKRAIRGRMQRYTPNLSRFVISAPIFIYQPIIALRASTATPKASSESAKGLTIFSFTLSSLSSPMKAVR